MDHKEAVTTSARDVFSGHMDEVLRSVRLDCDVIRAGEEPAHLRGVLRRDFGKVRGGEKTPSEVSIAEPESRHGVNESESTQQRDEVGRLLKAGADALEKLLGLRSPELTREELAGLECCLLVYGRPALFVSEGRLAIVNSLWDGVEDQREAVELAQRGVGRIELLGHPEYAWCGTGFLVGETTLMTTRRIAEIFAERRDGDRWEFRPGVSAWMDNRSQSLHPVSAGCRVEEVIGVAEHSDVALLRVERPPQTAWGPIPLTLAAHAPQQIEGREVYMIGYPVRDSRRNEPNAIARLFRDIYNVKRVHPGRIREVFHFGDAPLLRHDCGMLGNTGGSCILDLQTHEVLGLQVAGRYLEQGTAVPLWKLRDCPLMKKAGVSFAEVSAAEIESIRGAVDQIARTRYWAKLRTVVKDILQQAVHERTRMPYHVDVPSQAGVFSAGLGAPPQARGATEDVEIRGHIIDSLILPKILDCISANGGSFRIKEIAIGQARRDPSYALVEVRADDDRRLQRILAQIADHGAAPTSAQDCQLAAADIAGAFPEGFYSTTNQRTEIRRAGKWVPVRDQEMDCGILVDPLVPTARCLPMNEAQVGDRLVVGHAGVRVFPEDRSLASQSFEFMGSSVSTEKPKGAAIRQVARELAENRAAGGKTLLVAGPAVVHTGSGQFVSRLIRSGYVNVLFAGNALAAHDIEQALFGTSLGVFLDRGNLAEAGHAHHLRAINRIRRAGGIRQAVERGVLASGIMHECVRRGVDFLLAGSIRDDGPLPEVVTDVLVAQKLMREKLRGVTFCLMAATTLHSIAVGNLLPAWVRVVCADINPSTAIKLSDRGSFQTVGLVTDVAPFLQALVEELASLESAESPKSFQHEVR